MNWPPLPTAAFRVQPRLAMANAVGRCLPDFVSGGVRARLYRWAGFHIGPGAFIMGNMNLGLDGLEGKDRLRIGPGTVISTHVTVNLAARVEIGSNVCISPFVVIDTGSPGTNNTDTRVAAAASRPVIVEDGAWIRLGAVLSPGVTVGRGGIVGAGAVVISDVPPNAYVEGNPAQVQRVLPDEG